MCYIKCIFNVILLEHNKTLKHKVLSITSCTRQEKTEKIRQKQSFDKILVNPNESWLVILNSLCSKKQKISLVVDIE